MIKELIVKDFAIIESMQLTLDSGFTALTGETGAGKSLLIDAINLALGERAELEMIRAGSNKAEVHAVFDIHDAKTLMPMIAELGIEPEDGFLYIDRELSASRSICRINGRQVPLSLLKQIGAELVDIHGQHEHQALIHPEKHCDFFDAWIGKEALNLREAVSSLYYRTSEIKRHLEKLKSDARERTRLIDLYQYQLDEITKANLQPEEDEHIHIELSRLGNAEKLRDYALQANALISEAELNAYDLTAQALSFIESATALDPSMDETRNLLQSALVSIKEAAGALRGYSDNIEFNPDKLNGLNLRADLIDKLKRKYGESISEILEYAEKTQIQLEELLGGEEKTHELEQDLEKTSAQLEDACAKLHELRSSKAECFCEAVLTHLRPLAMERADFFVNIKPCSITAKGSDDIEFYIAPNPGELPKPLAKIASGGEISRAMLAIKSVLTSAAGAPTLIFDEIDSGLGGKAAATVGKKMAELAKSSQVMCITHLPQVAGYATHQVLIQKVVEGGKTKMSAMTLEPEARVRELARMIGGDELSQSALNHAREMLKTF